MSLSLTIAGKTTALLPAIAAKTGNTYWVIGGKGINAKFGVKISALADELPTSVIIEGEPVALTQQTSTFNGKTQAKGKTTILVGTEPKTFEIRITDHETGQWQVMASVHGIAGGARGARVQDDLFA
jgi:hypothetical protein